MNITKTIKAIYRPYSVAIGALLVGVCLAGCNLTTTPLDGDSPPDVATEVFPVEDTSVTSPQAPLPTVTPAHDSMSLPPGWLDVGHIMTSFCFESMWDARGRVFVLRSQDEHEALYDGANRSGLCAEPITPSQFDYEDGRVIVGLWSYGVGCVASHRVEDVVTDEAERRIVIRAHLDIEGDCAYELIRPLWLATDEGRSDYNISLDVVTP